MKFRTPEHPGTYAQPSRMPCRYKVDLQGSKSSKDPARGLVHIRQRPLIDLLGKGQWEQVIRFQDAEAPLRAEKIDAQLDSPKKLPAPLVGALGKSSRPRTPVHVGSVVNARGPEKSQEKAARYKRPLILP
ncbi:MAG: hypothetical protein C5B47_05375 [Verrucomicrobia bacterium]|nr:MAG: hypothetical protein C5B47_05375 [Verrucomicrobiota bacterium]